MTNVNQPERMLAVGETAALMTHRINNILQGINGGAHLVETGLRNGDISMAAKGWQTVSKQQSELSTLIFDLLNLGKPMELGRSTVDLVEITCETLSELNGHCQTMGVAVWIEDQPRSLKTSGDDNAIRTAIEHLVCVAARACQLECKPVLEFRFEKSEQEVLLRIDYQGAAICLDPEELLIPAKPEDRITAEIEFAIGRKIIREHRGEILVSKLGNRNHRILLTLPGESGR